MFISLFISLIFIFLMINKYSMNMVLLLTMISFYMLYWMVYMSFIFSFMFISLYSSLSLYNTMLINSKFNPLSWFMVLVVILISSIVMFNSLNYLSIIDSYLFLFYIMLFQLVMIGFVLSCDMMISLFYWELLGLISYLLINFWSSKMNCGIKAVLYNKLGDCWFMLLLVMYYSLLCFISYYSELSYSMVLSLVIYLFSNYSLFFIHYNIFIIELIPFSFMFILYSKSAQLPFSTWLLNAMSAPTPMSSLLHSSTMVMAGVYIGLILAESIIIIIDYFTLFFLFFYLVPLNTLLWSLFKAMLLNDIKSIIALFLSVLLLFKFTIFYYSNLPLSISQISYMFISLFINPMLCLYQVMIHSLFKSLLFLVASSLIHIQYNYQNMYQIKTKYKLYSIIYLLSSNMLVLSLSKEIIIHDMSVLITSPFSFIILYLGAMFTTLYTLKMYMYCFWIYNCD